MKMSIEEEDSALVMNIFRRVDKEVDCIVTAPGFISPGGMDTILSLSIIKTEIYTWVLTLMPIHTRTDCSSVKRRIYIYKWVIWTDNRGPTFMKSMTMRECPDCEDEKYLIISFAFMGFMWLKNITSHHTPHFPSETLQTVTDVSQLFHLCARLNKTKHSN